MAWLISLSHIFLAFFLQANRSFQTPDSASPLPQWEEVDLEEQQLRQKLHELTDNISDHSLSDEEESERVNRPVKSQEIQAWRSPEKEAKPSRIPSRPTSRTSIVLSRVEERKPEQIHSLKVDI